MDQKINLVPLLKAIPPAAVQLIMSAENWPASCHQDRAEEICKLYNDVYVIVWSWCLSGTVTYSYCQEFVDRKIRDAERIANRAGPPLLICKSP